MIYEVTVKFVNNLMSDLHGKFNSAYINEESEYLMLFQDISNSYETVNKTLRVAIPLRDIDAVEIIPIYEDNGQKIHSC